MCIGEALWDSLPLGLFPGGAPFNVALHLHELRQHVAFVTRVGDDVLGHELIRRVQARDLPADYIQVDPELPTGFVQVTSTDPDAPEYDIREPAAWDAIELQQGLLEKADEAAALVFGSLAQRNATTRETIRTLLDTDAPGVFDVNLRPPYDSREVVECSLQKTAIVKLNEDELARLAEWFGIHGEGEDAMQELAERFGCRTVCVTKGARGAALLHEGTLYRHGGYRVETVDAVGAGDAFLAGLLIGLLAPDGSPGATLEYANLLGAYVATQSGATPSIDRHALERIRR